MQDLTQRKENVISRLEDTLEDDQLDKIVEQIEDVSTIEEFTAVLIQLLINPGHQCHQFIARQIQELKSPSSIPYIRQMLESGFDFLEYTCSDSSVITKWFSWALASIGTEEAINLIKEYTHSEDEGIRGEMIYRLKRIEQA